MVAPFPPKDLDVKIKFGGGLHTRASADEIDAREASDGQNFLLDLDNRELRNRPPFDLVGTLPNALEVRGGGSLLKSDGTVTTLFQGGGKVYSWDGASTFTQVGTCSASSKLRGPWRSHCWTLSDKLLLTDLNLADVVKEWDGSTFQSSTFTKEDNTSFGSFYAKYLSITNEIALFANVKDGSGTTPHLAVGSAISNYNKISIANVPSTALSTSDPFYITMPDLKPINGMCQAFGTTIFSTEKGRLFDLDGSSAKDYAMGEFFAGSNASGSESIEYIGNDIIYGRQGRIESVRDTNTFGNSEADDLTFQIADLIGSYSGWTIVFNGRKNLVYLFPASQSECWVFNTAMRTSRQVTQNVLGQFVEQAEVQKRAGNLSPWMRWKTTHALAFQPTFVQSMLDPASGLEYVFMGDASGNIYRMEGSGTSGDGGSASQETAWTSKVFSAPLDAEVYEIEGYIKYKKNIATTVTLTLMCQGKTAFDQSITVNLPAVSTANYWGDTKYWGGSNYFGAAFSNRLIRQKFDLPGGSSDFQLKVDILGTGDFNINEIGMRFKAAS